MKPQMALERRLQPFQFLANLSRRCERAAARRHREGRYVFVGTRSAPLGDTEPGTDAARR